MPGLGSIIQSPMLAMLDTRHGLSLGRLGVATVLNQNIKHDPVLVDSMPQPMLLATDADHDLIEMPLVSRRRKTAADLLGEILAEFQRPLPDCLVADQDASGRQHLLDHAQAQGKTEVQPDGIADNFRRKAVASVARMTRRVHPSRMQGLRHLGVKLMSWMAPSTSV
jgi:hypothetical protein